MSGGYHFWLGASAEEADPALVSDQAAMRLAPTGFDPLRFRLCYVSGSFAWFTTASLDDQWGDDWDDVPYEHNAGTPYERDTHEIRKLVWEGPFDEPSEGHHNSPYSVEDINRRDCVPWLRINRWNKTGKSIRAGVTISEFCRLIELGGGMVYHPESASA